MQTIDFHIGYRVHSHIFSLSQRKASILIAEDSRGVGQVAAMGGTALSAHDDVQLVREAIDNLWATEGTAIQTAWRPCAPPTLRCCGSSTSSSRLYLSPIN
jgi:hypothetical protein